MLTYLFELRQQVYVWKRKNQVWKESGQSKMEFDKLPVATKVQLRDSTGSPGLQFEVCYKLVKHVDLKFDRFVSTLGGIDIASTNMVLKTFSIWFGQENRIL